MSRRDLIRFRRDTTANWEAINPILGNAEPGFDTDLRKTKMGDGITAWDNLTFQEDAGGGGGGGVSLGETSTTAYRGDRGKTAYDHSQVAHDKTLVGLANVDNTSDANKPVSTAQSTAIATAKSEAISDVRGGVAGAGDTLAKLYTLIQTLDSIVTGTTPDGDSVTDTIQEILAIFSTYPEGVDIATALSGKINTSAIVNTLTETSANFVLDARQGKALKDLIDALTTTVSGKETAANKSTSVTTDQASDTKYPSVKAVFDWVTATFLALSALGANIATFLATPSSANLASALTDEIGTGKVLFSDPVVNPQTGTSYSLVAGDNGKIVELNNASAITVTVPTSLGTGFNCVLVQLGAGQVTLSPSSTTLRNRNGLKTAGQYAAIAIMPTSTTDTFLVSGDCAA